MDNPALAVEVDDRRQAAPMDARQFVQQYERGASRSPASPLGPTTTPWARSHRTRIPRAATMSLISSSPVLRRMRARRRSDGLHIASAPFMSPPEAVAVT